MGCFFSCFPIYPSLLLLSLVFHSLFTEEKRRHTQRRSREKKRKEKKYILYLYTSSKANWRTVIKQTRGSICSGVYHFSFLLFISSLIAILVTIFSLLLLLLLFLLSASLTLHLIWFSFIFKINPVEIKQFFMVDLCRPSALLSNKTLRAGNGDNNPLSGNSNFFPSLLVCIDWTTRQRRLIGKLLFVSLASLFASVESEQRRVGYGSLCSCGRGIISNGPHTSRRGKNASASQRKERSK